jgi:hypothetical protein
MICHLSKNFDRKRYQDANIQKVLCSVSISHVPTQAEALAAQNRD